jgi:molybdopterin-guanine dinucleotide biosynthesis protein B
MPSPGPPILQIVGYKDSGKTTLLAALVRRFRAEGLSVAAIKHDAHDFEFDRPGTDTRKMAEAGADFVAISSPGRTVWTHNRPATLDRLVMLAAEAETDLVLVEGFKDAPHPKLVLLRGDADLPLLGLPNAIAAIVPSGSDWRPHAPGLPVYGRDDVEGICSFIRPRLFPT